MNALHFTKKNFVLIARKKEGCLKRKGRQSGQNEELLASIMSMPSILLICLYISPPPPLCNNVSLQLYPSSFIPFILKKPSHHDHGNKYHRNVGIMSICILWEDQGKPEGRRNILLILIHHSPDPGKRRTLSLHCKPLLLLLRLCEHFSLMHQLLSRKSSLWNCLLHSNP